MRMLSTQNRLQFGENAIFAICISGCLWLFFFNFVLLKKYYYLLYCIIFTHALNTDIPNGKGILYIFKNRHYWHFLLLAL